MKDEVAIMHIHAQMLAQDELLYPLERIPSNGSSSSMCSDFWSEPTLSSTSMSGATSMTSQQNTSSYALDVMEVDEQPNSAFKVSSPYYSAPIRSLAQVNFMPLTVSPRDAMIKSPQDDFYSRYDRMPSLFGPSGFDESAGQQMFIHPNEIQSLELLDTPEAMLEDDDDDDDGDDGDDGFEYDDVLSEDEEEDLFVRRGSFDSPYNMRNSLEPLRHVDLEPIAIKQEPDISPVATESPELTDLMVDPNSESTSPKIKRKLPSSAGPHRCEALNPQTGRPCGKVFSRPYDLIRHQDTIHAAVRKTFRCDLCGDGSKSFSRMDALSRHIRIKHGKA
jgi:hypothetical protein